MSVEPRKAIFISHATPQSNTFTLWLGAKLTALGYEVFADIFRLRGGDDWERILENAIRNRAAKLLLVATPLAVGKQGVRNEVNIALATAQKIGDANFIVPLRLEEFDPPLSIAHAQWVDFSKSWAAGLNELLDLLASWSLPRAAITGSNDAIWRGLQLKEAQSIGPGPEMLVSNWLAIDTLPTHLKFYNFKGGVSLGAAEAAKRAVTVPLVSHNRGFLSFAPRYQLREHFGLDLPLDLIAECSTDDFLQTGWKELGIRQVEARRKFADLARRGLDNFFESKGLLPFETATGQKAWWPRLNDPLKGMISFAWPNGPAGRRQIIGKSEKRGFYWHYGVVCVTRLAPIRHVRISSRIVFTTNGIELYGDAERLHRVRRSFCRAWRNDKWRDLLLTFLYWISQGAEFLDVPLGEAEAMRLRVPSMTFNAAFGIDAVDDKTASSAEDHQDSADEDVDYPPEYEFEGDTPEDDA
jgi:hypothetical protein